MTKLSASQTTTTTTSSAPTTSLKTTTPSPISGCPPSASIFPCTCSTSQLVRAYPELYITCNNLNLTDLQLSNVLNVLISPQFTSPVVSLSASQNQLTQIPNQISQFKTLANLDLSKNLISNISSLIGLSFNPSSASISINLNYNKITNIPAGTFKYPNATSIFVGLVSNQITNISSDSFIFSSATNSINIVLSENRISALPSGMFSYPSATSIYLGFWNNSLTAIPSGMFNYQSATYFSISFAYNQISSIPSNIFNCQNGLSISIDLSMNQISSLPFGLFNYPLTTDVYIGFNYNKITSIPSGMFNYSNSASASYIRIDLASNNLTTLSAKAFISSPATTRGYIYLQNNQITTITTGTFQGRTFMMYFLIQQVLLFAMYRKLFANHFGL